MALSTGFTLSVIRERDAAGRPRAPRAQREAEAKGQVSAFVLSMFRAGDPGSSGHPDLTASQLLAQGRARIDGELRGQPLLQSELKSVLAAVYDNIGQPQAAIELYDEALRIESARCSPSACRTRPICCPSWRWRCRTTGRSCGAEGGAQALAVLGQRPDAPALGSPMCSATSAGSRPARMSSTKGGATCCNLQLRAQWLQYAPATPR